ncbi:MAG: DUF4238 domain-containing protein [Clostridium baratii]|uniref:DUF4238 domain-containing protein n=1 Tax=Clostridium baratii TaxID=1561 RepID=UPI0024300193|nr:DUF4238 domain-containing protein [Clostridium baratii]MBS6041766.1 DUF4238 domain-containing protein [Clostridium baratii]
MNKVKNQHFVPRCYLKNFTNENEKINVFDKAKIQIRKNQNIENVASSRFFYDIDLDAIDKAFEKEGLAEIDNILPEEAKQFFKKACEEQYIEKWFSEEIEPDLSECIKNLKGFYTLQRISNIEKSLSISEGIKRRMSKLIAIQIVRSKEFRVTVIEQFPQLQLEMIKAIDRKEGKDIEWLKDVKADYKYPKEFVPILHAQFIMDYDFICNLAEVLYKHIWYIGVNTTNKQVYTSDNPIVKIEHKFDPIISNEGIASPGIEIVYPLSNELILIMKERYYHKTYEKYEMKYKILNENEIEKYNYKQIIQSYRCVFSCDCKFDMEEEVLKRNPNLSKIDRMRIQVH